MKQKQGTQKFVIPLIIILGVAFLCGIVYLIIPHRSMKKVNEYLAQNDTAAAAGMLKAMGEDGDTAAYNKLGYLYEQGTLPADQGYYVGQSYYLKSALLGNPYAEKRIADDIFFEYDSDDLKIGELTIDGKTYTMNDAVKFLSKAANQNYGPALFELGENYRQGTHRIKWNPKKALQCYMKGAKIKNVDCIRKMGDVYNTGFAVKKDPKKAFQYWLQAANMGDAEAMFNLAEAYSSGNGVEKDNTMHKYWLEESANHDYLLAEFFMGSLCQKDGDDSSAKDWFEKVDERNDYDYDGKNKTIIGEAELQLGLGYALGKFGETDYDKAEEYLNKALDNGIGDAEEGLEYVRLMQNEESGDY